MKTSDGSGSWYVHPCFKWKSSVKGTDIVPSEMVKEGQTLKVYIKFTSIACFVLVFLDCKGNVD